MLDIDSISQKNQTEIRSIGIYQIVGGAIGSMILIPSFNEVVLSTYILGILLFGFSIYSGIACVKFKNSCFNLTFINQLLQTFSVLLAGFTFEYISGIGLSLTLEMNEILKFDFDFNLPTLSAGFFDEEIKYHFGFNLVSIYIIYLSEKLKKAITKV